MKNVFSTLLGRYQKHALFFRILSFYLVGCIILLLLFSTVLTSYLTQKTTKDMNDSSKYTVKQAYTTINYILNSSYNNYYHLYQSTAMNHAMYSSSQSPEDENEILKMFTNAEYYSDCVNSVYIVNNRNGKVYSSEGVATSINEFYDKDALSLLTNYNEQSSDIFIARSPSYVRLGKQYSYHYITFLFSRKNADGNSDGALIINFDERKLRSQLELSPEQLNSIYIVSNTGKVVSHNNQSLMNTSIANTKVFAMMSQSKQGDTQFQADFNGKNCLVNYKRAPTLRFSFLSIVPVSTIDQQVSYIRTFTITITAVLLLLAFFLSMLFSKRIYSPFSKLVQGVKSHKLSQDNSDSTSMNEFDYLNTTYSNLFNEIKNLSSDNRGLSQVQTREVLMRVVDDAFRSEEECAKQLAQCGISFSKPIFLSIVIVFDNFDSMTKEFSPQDLFLFKYAIVNVASELLGEKYIAVGTENALDHTVLILNCDTGDGLPWIKETLKKVGLLLERHLSFQVSCGIGTFENSLIKLSKSYNHALIAASYRVVMEPSCIISYREIAVRETLAPNYPYELENNIIIAIRTRNLEKAETEISEFIQHITMGSVDSINMSFSQILIALNRVLKSLSVDEKIEQEFNFRVMSTQVKDCDYIEQKKEILLQFAKKIVESRNKEVKSKKNELIDKTCEFIHNNYSTPSLSIEDISQYAEISPSYFRSLFKEVTSKTPAEYIMDYRIEKAKELLETTDYSTKDIAIAVGYDCRYFYSVFKSKVGKTTTEYRKSMKKKEEL